MIGSNRGNELGKRQIHTAPLGVSKDGAESGERGVVADMVTTPFCGKYGNIYMLSNNRYNIGKKNTYS